jgi:hypothetical protein
MGRCQECQKPPECPSGTFGTLVARDFEVSSGEEGVVSAPIWIQVRLGVLCSDYSGHLARVPFLRIMLQW